MSCEDDDILDLGHEDLEAQEGERGDEAEEILELTHEDLADVPPPHPGGAPGGQLPAGPLPPPLPAEQELPPAGTPIGQPVDSSVPAADWAKAKKSALEQVTVAVLNVVPLALAGALGGFLAWGLLEPFTTDEAVSGTLGQVIREMALYGVVMGGCIGMLIGCVEGVTAVDLPRAARGAGVGLAVGAVGGAFGAVFGQILYSSLRGGEAVLPPAVQVVVRSVAWALVGAFVGVAPGLLARSSRKVINGLAGGVIGGALGGFLFDPIAFVVGGGELSRMVAMTVLGGAAGAGIGLVEQIRKQAWLIISAGPLTGKQFILYNPVTVIGRSPKADIPLVKETGAADMHCQLIRAAGRTTLEDLTGGHTFVNGRPVTRADLSSGDVITIGGTQLTYYERPAPEAGPVA